MRAGRLATSSTESRPADTGHHHIVPFLVAVLAALMLVGSLALTGLPH